MGVMRVVLYKKAILKNGRNNRREKLQEQINTILAGFDYCTHIQLKFYNAIASY